MAKDPFRANAKSDPLQKKLVELEEDIDKRRAALQKKQDKLRPDPYNAELRAEVQREKLEIGNLENQKATVAQAISISLGGTQHSFPIP